MKKSPVDNISKLAEMNATILKTAKIAERYALPKSVRRMIESQNRFVKLLPKFEIPNYNLPKFDIPELKPFLNLELLESLKRIGKAAENLKNNPELQFAFITDLKILNLKSAEEFKQSLVSDLTDEDINAKEEILSENLVPILEELGLENLWYGANYALSNQDNPDRLRHCLISLRTMLEYLIDEKMAPMDKIKDAEMFEKNFRKFHNGKQELSHVRIKRDQKIKYFISHFEFGVLEEFTKNEIQYVCDCYSILCNVHQPNVGITENQVKSLKVKTGITIWLLASLNKVLESDKP